MTGGFKYLSWDYCLDFMKTQKSLLLGIQGMSLAYELQKEELYLSGGSIYSLDKRENLFKVKSPNAEEKIPHNPLLDSRDSDIWLFQLSNNKCSDGDYILCFREYKRTHKIFEFM